MVEEKSKPIYKLVEVSTQSEVVIQTPNGEIMNVQQALVDILNKLDIILTKF
jgi:hypothetical protein